MQRRRLMLAGLFALALSGCFDFHQQIVLREDGGGRSVVQYAALDAMIAGSPLVQFMQMDAKGMMVDESKVRDFFGAKPGLKLRNVQLWAEGDKRFARVFFDFDHVSNLSEQGIVYQWKVEGKHKVLRIFLEKSTRSSPGRLQKSVAAGLKDTGFHFNVSLPRKIVESNSKKVDWSVAEWFVPLGYFVDPDQKSQILYAKVDATLTEQLSGWFSDLWPF